MGRVKSRGTEVAPGSLCQFLEGEVAASIAQTSPGISMKLKMKEK